MDEKKTVKDWVRMKSEAAKQKTMNAVDWCKNNKELIAIFGPVMVGSSIELIKIITKHHNLSEERALKDRYIYDRPTGHYYEMRRRPKTSEWLQIEQRKNNGESLGLILNDMRLLK